MRGPIHHACDDLDPGVFSPVCFDTICRRSGHGGRMGDHSEPEAGDLTLHPIDRRLQSGRDRFEKAMKLCVGGKAARVGLCEGNNAAYRCLRSVIWEDGPPGHSGRLLPSTPTRLADGLGPRRLPYALCGDTPPKTRVPRFCLRQNSAICGKRVE
jgi:hypothetical protein